MTIVRLNVSSVLNKSGLVRKDPTHLSYLSCTSLIYLAPPEPLVEAAQVGNGGGPHDSDKIVL